MKNEGKYGNLPTKIEKKQDRYWNMMGKWRKKCGKNEGNEESKIVEHFHKRMKIELSRPLAKMTEETCSVIWLQWGTTGAVAASEQP